MTRQLSVSAYVTQFQGALNALMMPLQVTVRNTYNPNFANERDIGFVVWLMRNIKQDAYTGSQANKGIDHPIFQVNVFASTLSRASQIADVIIMAWHGYSGNLNGISVGKMEADFLFNTYDEEAKAHQIVVDLLMQVAVPSA